MRARARAPGWCKVSKAMLDLSASSGIDGASPASTTKRVVLWRRSTTSESSTSRP